MPSLPSLVILSDGRRPSFLAGCWKALAVALVFVGPAIAEPPPLVNLRTDRFPFDPPATAEAWKVRAEELRRQVLVSAGLWPLPPRPEPTATVHRRLERDGYSVEAVSLESFPGHFVTGSLYRPLGAPSGKLPAVLSPHGHWGGGRFHRWDDDELAEQLAIGAERFERGGRCPLQARCVHLARSGCVVLLYDMLGYADSRQLSLEALHAPSEATVLSKGPSAWGFYSVQAELRQQNPLGVQLYNSLCALDWLASLEEVDPSRLGVTGASSGATQTLMLCAVDDRPAVAFPVVMVSTAMQGGCGCENACGLRLGTSNVEIASLRAPAPLGMASADDWTRDFATDGYPQMRRLYALLGAADRVTHASLVQFPHNYNHASRAAMYAWLGRWLRVEIEEERDFDPIDPDEIRIHPETPDSAIDRRHEVELMQSIATQSDRLIQGLRPHDEASLAKFRDVIGGAVRTLAAFSPAPRLEEPLPKLSELPIEGARGEVVALGLGPRSEAPAGILVMPPEAPRGAVLWACSGGAEGLVEEGKVVEPALAELLASRLAVLIPELPDFSADREAPTVPGMRPVAALTYGYNQTVVARRAEEVVRLAAALRRRLRTSGDRMPVGLVAERRAAPFAALSLALAGDAIDAALIDTEGFRFTGLESWKSEAFFPGAVKYGDLPALLALGTPRPAIVVGEAASQDLGLLTGAYDAAGAGLALRLSPAAATVRGEIRHLVAALTR